MTYTIKELAAVAYQEYEDSRKNHVFGVGSTAAKREVQAYADKMHAIYRLLISLPEDYQK